MQFSTALAVLGLAALGQAHVVINTPVPFLESIRNNDNGPLDASGSDFPCKAGGVYTAQGPSTPMELGSIQPLSMTGGATHGGGSCQISITYDTAPTKNSVWKVIHSIQGGCPMVVDGNLSGSSTTVVPTSYTFTIPGELPAGEAVLAWTWFNTIGNREMYMNCAPITITAGSKRRDENSLEARNATQLAERDVAAYNSLPDMFKANIGPGSCTTVEGSDLRFPNPGSSVDNFADTALLKDCDASVAPSQPASPVTSAPATSVAAPSASASSQVSLPGGVFFPVPNPTNGGSTTAAPIATTSVTSAPVQAPTSVQAPSSAQPTTLIPVPTKATSAAPPAGTGTVGGGSALTGACSTEGAWNCIDGKSFQQCGSGTWSVPMQVAAGTSCTTGQGQLDIHAIGTKRRNVRFSGAHIRRHLHSS